MKPKFPNDKKTDKWYIKKGWKKTDWGYTYLIDGIGFTRIMNYKLYKKQEEAKGAIFYDCTPTPFINKLEPGETAIVGVKI